MGQQPSSEAFGVRCSCCAKRLPPNNWDFIKLKSCQTFFYYSFQASTEDDRMQIDYVRQISQKHYSCMACLEKVDRRLFKISEGLIAARAFLDLPKGNPIKSRSTDTMDWSH